MREIVYIERAIVTEKGSTVVHERRYSGLLEEDGTFHLLGYCRKRFPADREQLSKAAQAPEHQNNAA